ncbi:MULTISPECIES: biotin carboxylase N-terminal domain-containing protein [unclassified Bacillus (in: firmicutes)]|uniref:acetyl-CoA carboxylase biotin carboxylase subunit n=1 Tax=unclassified Bacillus (in: firmicutes) TaxID=185979 RepID=UPI000414A698|nr:MULTISPECIES: biotin carboxylase N-terminal domain-containing protein [unclassified Bacillus (in: firmicutes)]PGZ94192.1 biotin carboxylase [Bacillus sp. AFS029533]SFD19445.1 acetyl-CoA carboxylase, biotin carboxylase subunit [Bacillus sp. UNCCL81]
MIKILIANRGEIACRIIETCKKLRYQTVAVYSDADKESLHVKLSDEAFSLKGNHTKDTYLNADLIIKIAKENNVTAIHPGYGFLSENSDFARKCKEAGILFVGPKPEHLEMMGEKIRARQIMEQLNIPLIKGNSHPIQSVEEAREIAEQIGYPVMLKASSGGGGIGMKLIENEAQLEKEFLTTQTRALQFFANDDVFIEKAIIKPRHIEAQIAADTHGNAVFLFERDCSIQRRNQKVVEEAPSPFLSPQGRKKLEEYALTIANQMKYVNVGTIEFLVDEKENIYFLEMNTRLQVEHGVTEGITGIDLVEWQFRITFGETLPIRPTHVEMNGHSIEVRVYAEDPKTFFPSPGTVHHCNFPEEIGVRIDTHLYDGWVVSPFYDPLLAKVIVTANTRKEAVVQLHNYLKKVEIEGIKTNLPFLIDILSTNAFQEGDYTTSFISEYQKVK